MDLLREGIPQLVGRQGPDEMLGVEDPWFNIDLPAGFLHGLSGNGTDGNFKSLLQLIFERKKGLKTRGRAETNGVAFWELVDLKALIGV